ncbi:superoxide dismutase [Cu-Zn] SodC [Microbulbifer sp. HZ11]|uniref:superoxide dismutase [Cu-Zn] SodC n=1 Tax=unclassified Microbulbifer TaxID=2619833 RepID=UPI000ABC1065|nr:superoxide dismutase [Cu-Zn] SodC [Microbulbifer sp. HZ11]
MSRIFKKIALSVMCCGLALPAAADTVVTVLKLDKAGVGTMLGTVTVTETAYGLVFTPKLDGLPKGLHGFHLHENGSCEPAEKEGEMVPGLAAGSHYDPQNTGKHGMPWGDGHLGDLPALYVDSDGKAMTPVLAPRLKKSDLKGRALMVHAGGDNYSDQPKPLGGGGARIACGVIQ